jgi:hypothetical protein
MWGVSNVAVCMAFGAAAMAAQQRDRENMKRKNDIRIVEFAFGFIVVKNGERIAIVATEDDAERVARKAAR